MVVCIKEDCDINDVSNNDDLCTQDMLPWFTKLGYTLKPDLVDMSWMTV